MSERGPSRAALAASFAAMGAFALASQTALFREYLVVYGGNELGAGFFFSSWLLWVGAGALLALVLLRRAGGWVHRYPLLLALYPPALLAQLLLIRSLRGLAGVEPTDLFPTADLFLATFLTNAPVSLVTGFLFPIAAAAGRGASRVYVLECLGAFCGGAGFTLLLIAGGAVADYDNDGDLDWFVTSIWHENPTSGWTGQGWTGNRLYRNAGDGTFEDVTTEAGVRKGYWGWACSFSDFNHDGHLDIAHVNGWPGYGFETDPSRLFMSNGDGTFTESSQRFGFIDHGQGRGMMCFDFDNDGDVDIFVENLDQPWQLFRNDLYKGNYLIVKLRGQSRNSEAVGARVYVVADGKTQMREIHCGSNYISQNPTNAHFGLGTAKQVDRLSVCWPDGTVTVQTAVPANQRLLVTK